MGGRQLVAPKSASWYRVERTRNLDRLTEPDRDHLHRALAETYAAAHSATEALDHFLDHRDPREFDVIYTARADGRIVAWFGASRSIIDGWAVTTFDDAVVHPDFQRRGLSRTLMLRAFRAVARDAVVRRSAMAMLTTNPIVALAFESALHPRASRFPGIIANPPRSAEIDRLSAAVASRLHPEAPFDVETGVMSDFLPPWHVTGGTCPDAAAREYFDAHLEPGSAILLLIPVDVPAIIRHGSVLVAKSAKTVRERHWGVTAADAPRS